MHRPDKSMHFTDFAQIKRYAFLLLNLGYGFNSLLEDREGDVAARRITTLFREYGGMYEREVSSLLIGIAIASRILDDRLINFESDATAKKFPNDEMLGDDEEGQPINLRQCFNKIIHASCIEHELQLPEVCLLGKNQVGKEWCARIFLMPFCTAVYQWVDHCQRIELHSDDA